MLEPTYLVWERNPCYSCDSILEHYLKAIKHQQLNCICNCLCYAIPNEVLWLYLWSKCLSPTSLSPPGQPPSTLTLPPSPWPNQPEIISRGIFSWFMEQRLTIFMILIIIITINTMMTLNIWTMITITVTRSFSSYRIITKIIVTDRNITLTRGIFFWRDFFLGDIFLGDFFLGVFFPRGFFPRGIFS